MAHEVFLSMDPFAREAHYAAIGRLATNWAALDAIVTSAIWQLGEMDDEIGACITSQIYTFDGKVKALVAMLNVRGGLNKVVKAMNEFHNDTRPLLAFRNRLIHDPLHFDAETDMPRRLQISADKSLVLGYEDEPTDNVMKHAVRIAEMTDRFQRIIKPAMDRYPPKPLPEKP